MQTIGDRIQELCNQNNMRAKHLANALNVSPSTITRIINDEAKPKSDTLKKIASYFQVSMDYLENGSFAYTQTDLTRSEYELLCNYRLLNEDDQSEVSEIIQMKLRRSQKKRSPKLSPLSENDSSNKVG